MRFSAFLIFLLMTFSQAAFSRSAYNSVKSFFTGNTNTEAGICTECEKKSFRGRSLLGGLPMDLLGSETSDIEEAKDDFKKFVDQNPHCKESKFGVISDLSNGTANNKTHIIEYMPGGGIRVIDSFQAGEGDGIGNSGVKTISGTSNICESNSSPEGFIKIGQPEVRQDRKVIHPRTKEPYWSGWPRCTKDLDSKTPGFDSLNDYKYNKFSLIGLEKGVNDNIHLPKCPGGVSRAAFLHSISYDSGPTTRGCKGFPIEKWCKYAPSLKGACIYNYDGTRHKF